VLTNRDLHDYVECLIEILEVNLLLDVGLEQELARELIANTGRVRVALA
jgi:hypothetical protein